MHQFYGIVFKLLVVKIFLQHVVFAKDHDYYSPSKEIDRRSERTWTDDFKDDSPKEITIHLYSKGYFSRDRKESDIYLLKYKSENVPKRSHAKQTAKQTEIRQSQSLREQQPFLKDIIRYDRRYDGSSSPVAEFSGKNHDFFLSNSFSLSSLEKLSFLNPRETTNSNRDYGQTVLSESPKSNIYRSKSINSSPLIVPISYNYPSVVRFPLFFINPATKIIYALTEVGKWEEKDKAVLLIDYNSEIDNKKKNNENNDNKIINQEKDKNVLKQENQKNEQVVISFDESFNRNNFSNSSSGNLQETKKKLNIPSPTSENNLPSLLPLLLSPSSSPPLSLSSSPITITAPSPTSSHRMHSIPPPILVKTELTVQDRLAPLPLRRNPTAVKTKKLQRKRKKKFKKRPGRYPATSTPFVETFPKVINGKRHPIVFSPPQEAKVRIQLEKPISLPLTVVVDNLRSFEFMKNISGNFHSERRRKENIHRFRREAIYENFDSIKTIKTNLENVPMAKQQQTTDLSTIKTTTSTTTTTMTAEAASVKELIKNNKKLKIIIKNSQPEVLKLGPIKRTKRKRHNSFKREKQNQNDYDYFDLYEEDDDEEDDEEEEYDNSKEYDNNNDDNDEKDYGNHYKYKSKHKQKNRRKVSGMRVKKRPGIQTIDKKGLNESQQNDSYDSGGVLQESNSKVESESSMEESIEYNSHSEIIEDSVASSEVGEGVNEYDIDNYQEEQVSQVEEEEDEEQGEDENEYENDGDSDYSVVKPTQTKQSTDNYDNDDDGDDEAGISGIGAFLNTLFYPLHFIMEKIFGYESSSDTKNSNAHQPENSYLVYHNSRYPQPLSENESHENDDDDDDDDNDGNSLFDRFSSWLGLSWRTTKKIDTSIGTPSPPFFDHATTEKPSNWLQSWFSYDYEKTTPEPPEESNNDWFYGWFKTKNRRGIKPPRPPPPQPPLTTAISHVPILTIVDPMRNPQSWIGLLAHHITNGTAATSKPSMLVINNRPSAATSKPNMSQKRNYNKYQIWRLKPQDDDMTRVLEDYKRSREGNKLQWLKRPTLRGLNDVLIPPNMLTDFAATLRYESIAHEVIIFDVGKVIAYEKLNSAQHSAKFSRQTIKSKQKSKSFSMSWQKYYQYDDIVKYLESIRSRYPQIVELIHIGRSYEGRPLIICKIKSKETDGSDEDSSSSVEHKRLKFKKKSGHANAIFIESGMHGMEWIGPATSTWMISELLRIMKSNKTTNDIQQSIRKTTWYILPVLNPDGYEYTHKYDRFWRKSRSHHVYRPSNGFISSALTWLQKRQTSEKTCYGVDLDSNWRYQWGQHGASQLPCNEYYAGPVPFSEPETKILSEFLLESGKQIKLYISLQAYGQVLSYPSNTNTSFNAAKVDDIIDVAQVAINELRKRGSSKSRYRIDFNNDLVGKRSGCADAFAAFEVGIPFSYTLYLADNGVHGYLLPSSAIESTAQDAFEIITTMIDYIR